jgi:hypothetical protein
MKLSRNSSILLFIAMCCFCPVQASGQNSIAKSGLLYEAKGQRPDSLHSLYESWIRDYRVEPLKGAVGIEQRDIELEITVVEYDDLDANPRSPGITDSVSPVVYRGCAVSTDGTVSHFRRSAWGVKGGGLDTLAKDEFERLQQLIAQLPEDHGSLPPAGHRIVLQVASRNEVLARVYDRGNAPAAVLEILRLSHSEIRPLTLDFPPQQKWRFAEFSEKGIPANAIRMRGPDAEETTILAISLARDLTVRQVLHDTPAVTITDSNPSNVIRVLRVPQDGNRFVGITNADFTPDGDYLLLLTTLPGMVIYDTENWREVRSLPNFPKGASLYFPSSDWKYGIVLHADGDAALWDAESRRQVSKIDIDGGLFAVAFSPDDSMVATSSGHENNGHYPTLHLRIWNVGTGDLVEELRPFEQSTTGYIGEPMWWPDGKYLLATVRDNPYGSNHDIGVWSVRSGRFRGEFSGCVYSADPLSIVIHDSRLFERCRDGIILMWDGAAAIDKIAAYEISLTKSPD